MHMKDANSGEFKERIKSKSDIKVVILQTGDFYNL